MKNYNYENTIKHVGIQTIIWNLILSIIKFIAGVFSLSSSMISDSVHSATDTLTTIIIILGAKISSKNIDKEHPYGHERFESLASIFLGTILIFTSLSIGYSGITVMVKYFNGGLIETTKFAYLAFISAVLSIVVKGIMFLYTYKVAIRIKSPSLKADSYHHLSDSLSSTGSLLGIIGLMIGSIYVLLDPIASLIICLFIFKIGIDIIIESSNHLVDKSASDEFCSDLTTTILSFGEVKRIDLLKTRRFGNKIYVDIDISLDKELSFIESTKISNSIHDLLEENFKEIKHCMIHVNPYL